MMKERLTKSKWTNDNCKPVYDKNGDIVMDKELFDLLITEHNRLSEYEDDEESGKIVRLPCKVGDTIYVIRKDGIEKREVKRFHIGRNGWYAVYYGTTLWDCNDRLGKAWFLTREEAEKRLKELQNG